METWQKQRKNKLLLNSCILFLQVTHFNNAILGGSKDIQQLLFIYKAPCVELGNPEGYILNSSKIKLATGFPGKPRRALLAELKRVKEPNFDSQRMRCDQPLIV